MQTRNRWLVGLLAVALFPAFARATPEKRVGLGAAAYTKQTDQWALFRAALGNEKQVNGAILRQRIARLPSAKRGMKLLDVGAADGELTSHYAGLAKSVVALEISEPLLAKVKSQPGLADAITVAGNVEEFVGAGKHAAEFRETYGKYDAVVMSHMLFAVGDPVATVKGAADLLRKDGKAFILVPDDDGQFQRFRREFVARTALNPGSNLPSDKLIAGLRALGYKMTIRRVPGSFTTSVADMKAMTPILGDVDPATVAARPEISSTLSAMLDEHADKAGRIKLSNDSILIELAR